ncbi:MAG: glycoside hydrolase family 10 protein [Limnospira sp.]
MIKITKKNKKIVLFIIAFLVALGFFKNQFIVPIQARATTEIRGVWLTNVDSDILFSNQGVKQALDRLQNLHFNTIYPTVWQGGYTLYPSAVAGEVFGVELDPTPGLQGRDILQELVEEGHQRQLTVIPWFEFGFMVPVDSPLAKRHPNWLTTTRDGSLTQRSGNPEWGWLNPFHPEVQDFILNLIAEIVKNYDIDGIQFDDHFGLPSEFGYDAYTVQLFRQQHDGQSPPDNPSDTYWVRWRADRLNEFMERVFYAVKAIKSDGIISLSPNPLHFALPAYLQDWFTWERRGLIEELVVQVYRPDIDRFITELEREEIKLANGHIPVVVGILSGLKNRPTATETLNKKVEIVRDRNFAGISFFFYESLWNWAEDSPAEREDWLKTIFSEPMSRLGIGNRE